VHECWKRLALIPVPGFDLSQCGGVSNMSLDNVRPEENLLIAFTLTIAGAVAAGLPMAVAIIWICS
jgi:hypothetical protein